MDIERAASICLREAIARLGLIEPGAFSALLPLVRYPLVCHPRQLALEHRKAGEQLSASEKKANGLRKSAFMSRAAWEQLTEEGRERPLVAHEVTLLRAIFSLARYCTQASDAASVRDAFRYDMLNIHSCRACARLAKLETISGAEVHILPPLDCEREACNISFRMYVNYIDEFIARYRAAQKKEP